MYMKWTETDKKDYEWKILHTHVKNSAQIIVLLLSIDMRIEQGEALEFQEELFKKYQKFWKIYPLSKRFGYPRN